MPKNQYTRKGRAKKLLEYIERGPSFLNDKGNAELSDRYSLWSLSWVVPELKDLVPELRPAAKKKRQETIVYGP